MPKETFWQRVITFAKEIWAAYIDDRVPLAAAAVAFFLVLSMIPLLLLLVSVAAFFVDEEQLQRLISDLTVILGPGVGSTIRSEVLSVVQNRGLLTGISLLVGLWAGSQLFVMIELAMNQIWDVKESRSFWVLHSLALLMVFLIGILVALAIAFTYLIQLLDRIDTTIVGLHISGLPWFVKALLGFLLPLLLMIIVFSVIYRYLPAKRVPWGTAAPGALIAGILWVIATQILSWYSANIANYSVIYGSLGGLILLMLWFNYSSQIMLVGAEISAVLQERRSKRRKESE